MSDVKHKRPWGKRWVGSGALVLSLCALYSQPLEGTTVKPLSDQKMCEEASRIFHGTCEEVRTEWDSRGRLVTRYRFRVQEGLKGSRSPWVEFVQPGGRLGDRALVVPGAATFKPNEEAVVFVGRQCARTGCAFTVGLAQGKFSVKKDPRTSARVASRDLEDLEFIGEAPQPSRPLTTLLASIRSNVRNLEAAR